MQIFVFIHNLFFLQQITNLHEIKFYAFFAAV